MLPDAPVPLAEDSPGCVLESTPRMVQNGSKVYSISLNKLWLSQLGINEQGAATVHALATRPVEITQPAIIIQPASVENGGGRE